MKATNSGASALFAAAREVAASLFGSHDPPVEIILRTHSGQRLRLSVPWHAAAAPDAPVAAGPRHGVDFRSVNWFGKVYSFGGPEAAVVKLLWEAWEQGTPDVGDRLLLQASGTVTARLSDVFRGNAAWGTMVAEGGSRGTHRLAEPEGPPAAAE